MTEVRTQYVHTPGQAVTHPPGELGLSLLSVSLISSSIATHYCACLYSLVPFIIRHTILERLCQHTEYVQYVPRHIFRQSNFAKLDSNPTSTSISNPCVPSQLYALHHLLSYRLPDLRTVPILFKDVATAVCSSPLTF